MLCSVKMCVLHTMWEVVTLSQNAITCFLFWSQVEYKMMLLPSNTLFSGTGKLNGNSGSIIKRDDYSEGYTIIVADLTPFETGDNFDLKGEGPLSINLVFKSPPAVTINVLVYVEYNNIIEIDSNSYIIEDWSN